MIHFYKRNVWGFHMLQADLSWSQCCLHPCVLSDDWGGSSWQGVWDCDKSPNCRGDNCMRNFPPPHIRGWTYWCRETSPSSPLLLHGCPFPYLSHSILRLLCCFGNQ